MVHYKEGKIHLESVLKQGEIISKWGFKKRLHRIMAFETEVSEHTEFQWAWAA